MMLTDLIYSELSFPVFRSFPHVTFENFLLSVSFLQPCPRYPLSILEKNTTLMCSAHQDR